MEVLRANEREERAKWRGNERKELSTRERRSNQELHDLNMSATIMKTVMEHPLEFGAISVFAAVVVAAGLYCYCKKPLFEKILEAQLLSNLVSNVPRSQIIDP